MWWRVHDGMGWWMLFGGLLWLLFWGTIVYVIVSLVSRGRGGEREPRTDPLEVAKLRYARGEITREDFEAIRKDLRGAA
ncbi:MAG: SHOCT domain-containing protein [Actinomycetota bacterium]